MTTARSSAPQNVARLFAWTTVLVPLAVLVWPWLAVTGTYGWQDWDVETSHRYLTIASLRRYGEAPFWNPYACGGFPAWGFIEGGTNLVSPWALSYLALPMSLALRVEVIGSGLLGAVGAFFAAGRFTRSYAGRALVVALWAVDSRWSLQAGAGHTWHLLYAWMPWCLYLYERSREEPARARYVVALAAVFALILYGGGIYPLPHVVLALSLYACALALIERSSSPLRLLGLAGALAILLAAPKLLPMLHELARSPRLIASTEATSPTVVWLALAGAQQMLRRSPVPVPYGWHEYGMYISIAGVVVLLAGMALARGRREAILASVGATFLVLGLGSFAAFAPWPLLHRLPLFASQHVPSRFLYPALLLFALVAASGLGRFLSRRPWADALATVAAFGLAMHVALGSGEPMRESMRFTVPAVEFDPAFHHERTAPFHYKPFDPETPMYPAMLGNRGVLQCYGAPPIDRVGALSADDPGYRGEAYLVGAAGDVSDVSDVSESARVVDWSPNHAVVELSAPAPATRLVYNMNYDDGWTSDRGPVVDEAGRVAVDVVGMTPGSRVTFVYRPRLFVPGLLLGALGGVACLALAWRNRAYSSAKKLLAFRNAK
jgi:hypothetical protein